MIILEFAENGDGVSGPGISPLPSLNFRFRIKPEICTLLLLWSKYYVIINSFQNFEVGGNDGAWTWTARILTTLDMKCGPLYIAQTINQDYFS